MSIGNTLRVTNHDIVSLEGNVEVGYFQEGGRWFALARQFDLMGSGHTKDRAFRQLQGLVGDYVEACITDGTDEFFSACPDEEWERTRRHREAYLVILVFARRTRRQKAIEARIKPDRLDHLARYRRRLVTAALAELAGAV